MKIAVDSFKDELERHREKSVENHSAFKSAHRRDEIVQLKIPSVEQKYVKSGSDDEEDQENDETSQDTVMEEDDSDEDSDEKSVEKDDLVTVEKKVDYSPLPKTR
jgi:hypothetical protein